MEKEKIKITINNGIYDCDANITIEEWKNILKDKTVTFDKTLDALVKFYLQPGYKSYCKKLGEIYGVEPNVFNSIITQFGKRVQEKLNRFHVLDLEDENTYWVIPVTGRYIDNRKYFEWTLRTELVQAMEELKLVEIKKYTWVPFYIEFAAKLNNYKSNRTALLDYIYNNIDREHTKYLHDSDNENMEDIDPFTVIGIFNRGLSDEKRLHIASIFKEFLNIEAPMPSEFKGVPVLDNRKSHFFGFKEYRKDNDINNLWELFDQVVKNNNPIDVIFNTVIKQYCIKINITMGLYWISPYNFLSLDGCNKEYLKSKYNFTLSQKIDNFEKYLYTMNNVKEVIEEKSFPELSVNAWLYKKPTQEDSKKTTEPDNTTNLEPYYSLLLQNKNLILTGAPGTGKTYLAKEIAKAMGDDNPGFVQFHPSYDYTDFVEGLRPTTPDENGNIGFELKNGVFKEFCKKAISKKKGPNFDVLYDDFIINKIGTFELFTPHLNKPINFEINSKKSFLIKTDKTKWVITKALIKEYVVNDIILDWKSYVVAIGDKFKEIYESELYKISEENVTQNHVFIIDEINRGEISKIFGELFYSIDPGYRVKAENKNKNSQTYVKTQYANIQMGDTIFDPELKDPMGAFYVPDNVYIIGTMNDIDRGVESMDFAIRRRFTWCEITAAESAINMGIPDDIKGRMTALNNKISSDEIGLNSAYHIGASHFLEKTTDDLQYLWDYKLKSLLREYLRGDEQLDDKINKLAASLGVKNE